MKIKGFIFLMLCFLGTFSQAQDGGAGAEAGSGPVAFANYVIRPFDVLVFRVFQEPDLDSEVRVESDGSVRLPLVGVVQVSGRTLAAAQNELVKLYDADFLVNPQINLQVISFVERKVNVLGQVNRPGFVLIPPDRPLFLTDAIAGSGGPTRLANIRRIQLKRTLANGEVLSRELNLDQVMSNASSRDFPLEDGDTLFVPERNF